MSKRKTFTKDDVPTLNKMIQEKKQQQSDMTRYHNILDGWKYVVEVNGSVEDNASFKKAKKDLRDAKSRLTREISDLNKERNVAPVRTLIQTINTAIKKTNETNTTIKSEE